MGTYRLTAHSFVILISFLVNLVDFTLGIQPSIYILLIPAILEHWIDIEGAGLPQLSPSGMIFKQMWFCRERLLVGIPY